MSRTDKAAELLQLPDATLIKINLLQLSYCLK